jgi:hypothetical protein
MKILLILLLAVPCYSQITTPCDDAQKQRQIVKAVKQFKPAYKKVEVLCANGEMVLAFEANRVDPHRLVTAVYQKLQPEMESLGLTRLLIEGRAWDKEPADNAYYKVTPTHVIATRTGSTSISTITGGDVVKIGGYSYHRNVVRVLLEK